MFKECAIALLIAVATVSQAFSQEPRSYPDGNGGEVLMPSGEMSFADEAVSYAMGEPAPIDASRDPAGALGAPDWESLDFPERFLTLGCGGEVVLRFTNNALVDTAGTDLYVFEVGPDVEATELAISRDGETWIEVGGISGGRADVDIGDHVESADTFSYVRLTDDGQGCDGRWPGADIDSVAAIGSAERFVFDGAVLFAFDSSDLRTAARNRLRELADKISHKDISALRIDGHTDARGKEDYNDRLSRQRAEAVRQFLAGLKQLSDVELSARGRGEREPIATNDTEAGRSRNRRVEIIAVPGS